MQQVGPVLHQIVRKLVTQPLEGVCRHWTHAEAGRNPRRSVFHRKVCNKLRFAVKRRETLQQVPDVDLIAREVTAYRVRVDSELHANLQYSRPHTVTPGKIKT